MIQPDWLHKHPSEWPPAARNAFAILLRAAERRAEREHRERKEHDASSA